MGRRTSQGAPLDLVRPLDRRWIGRRPPKQAQGGAPYVDWSVDTPGANSAIQCFSRPPDSMEGGDLANSDLRGGGRRTRRFKCFDSAMTLHSEAPRVVSASREVAAAPEKIFELIADPTQQPRWDGNDNLAEAVPGQRIRAVGDTFAMTTTKGVVRENHVVEFQEGRRIAWKPAEPGQEPPGHLWRWELDPLDESRTKVTHTYDWTTLTDENRLPRARSTTADKLQASLDRLAALAEGS
jgi:uncharacterized protein YndB with AHSA1/START domain